MEFVHWVRRPSAGNLHVVVPRAVVVPLQAVRVRELLAIVKLFIGGGSVPEVGDLRSIRVVSGGLYHARARKLGEDARGAKVIAKDVQARELVAALITRTCPLA